MFIRKGFFALNLHPAWMGCPRSDVLLVEMQQAQRTPRVGALLSGRVDGECPFLGWIVGPSFPGPIQAI